MTTDYQLQATDFLQSTGTAFTSEFLRFDYHFTGDTQKRNIFKITLKNDRHKYSFEFGSSLKDSLVNCNDTFIENEIDVYYGLKYEGLKIHYLSYSDKITIARIKESMLPGNNPKHLLNRKKATDIYNEFIKANTNKYQRTVNIITLNEWIDNLKGAIIRKASDIKAKNFGEGIQNTTPIHPTPYDVLSSITKYEVGTFANFCSDYGYDADSRTAYKTYKAVMKEWKNVELLFTPDQLELLQEIS